MQGESINFIKWNNNGSNQNKWTLNTASVAVCWKKKEKKHILPFQFSWILSSMQGSDLLIYFILQETCRAKISFSPLAALVPASSAPPLSQVGSHRTTMSFKLFVVFSSACANERFCMRWKRHQMESLRWWGSGIYIKVSGLWNLCSVLLRWY